MAVLTRPDDLETWTACLNKCVENGLFTAEEVESILRDDGVTDYFLEVNLKQRLYERSVNKLGFAFAFECLKRQLVKESSSENLV